MRPFSGSCTTSRFFDDVADLGCRDLQHRGRPPHFDLFAEALHAQCKFDGDETAHFQIDLLGLGGQSLETRCDVPGSDAQRRQQKPAVAVCDPLDDDAGGDMGGSNRGAGKHAT